MKLTASGGTDGASIVLFWPDNLPDGADAALKDDPVELIERTRERGELIWFPCDGDGPYDVAVFVRSPVPDDLLKVCRDAERYPVVRVRGDGYFGGMEYVFKHDDSLLRKYSHMAGRIAIPPGDYAATVYRTELSGGMMDTFLRETAGPAARRAWAIQRAATAAAVLGALAATVTVFFVRWSAWLVVASFATILCGAAIGTARTQAYRRARRARGKFRERYPSYVVHLE